MRLTIDRSLTDTHDVEIDAAMGARASEVLDGTTSKRAWCGSTLLDPSHEVGVHPLLHGARLRDSPGPHTAPPAGPHLAAIAGPDAGVVIEIEGRVAIGSAPGRDQIRDDALDPTHLVVKPTAPGALACRDAGTMNGTGWWRYDGQRWWWSGRRRRFTARQGDILTVGNTALQVRGNVTASRHGNPRQVLFAAWRLLARLPWWPSPSWVGLPDPTVAAGWTGDVRVTGPGAREAARAVILARGRRPPSPPPFDEEWLRWLPAALPTDGPVRCGSAARAPMEVTLEAHADHCRLSGSPDTAELLPMAVSERTADALARTLAGAAAVPWSHAVRWADVDRPHLHTPDGADLSVALGAACSPASEPWIVVLNGRTPHLLAAGARAAGASTLLATLVGGLAHHYDSRRLRIVLIGSGTDGPLAPCASLPHITSATATAGDDEAVRVLSAVANQASQRRDALQASGAPHWRTWEASGNAPGRLLVVVDDFDLATGRSRTAAAAIEALTTAPVFVGIHVALATHRPAGAVTPALRSACHHTVALRSASESDSRGVIGVPDAAALDAAPGRAVVNVGGIRTTVQVALPFADASPRVRRADAGLAPALHLADAVVMRARQEGSAAPGLP
ncbi:MAG TPA: FtsK/SpoIIIE domain-containing protein [Demequina sp.]|nr:FtsK/SpoIIIE domain-containing protein [Demequina sp.]